MGRDHRLNLAAGAGRHPKKLIRAAALAAKDKGEPPPELRHLWACQRWGVLPVAGGMNEQDYAALTRMEDLGRVYRAVAAWKTGKADPSELKVVGWLTREGMMK